MTTLPDRKENLGSFIGSPSQGREGKDLGGGLCGEPAQPPHFSERGR